MSSQRTRRQLDQQAREHVPARALHPRGPVLVRPLETRPVVARPMAAPSRDASTGSGGYRCVGEQDGSHLLEGAHERGRISGVPDSSRVAACRRIARSTCCDGRTDNRRTVSLSDKPVEYDRRRYEDRCARIPSRPGTNGFHEQAGYISATVFAITSKCDLERRGRPYIYRE